MSKMNPVAVANEALRILDKLHTEKGEHHYASVPDIAEHWTDMYGGQHRLPDEKHQYLRGVLERLYGLGTVEKKKGMYGKKSYKYKILVASWDKRDPFKKINGTLPSTIGPVAQTFGKPSMDEETAQAVINLERKLRDAEERERILQDTLKEVSTKGIEAVERIKELEAANAKLKEEKDGQVGKVKVLTVKKWDGKVFKLKDKVFPKVFTRAKELAECRRNIMLFGPAGCGKSHLAELLAEVLDLPFAALSCTAGMTESHLLGRAVPDLTHGKNRFQGSDFLKTYEEGGLFLLDELDAADANVLLCINSGLANGYINIPNRPDKPRAVRHRDNVIVATANTIGRGATRMYTGRNAIDEATLDRFRIGQIEMDYDQDVEKALVPDEDGVKEYTPREKGRTTMKVNGYGSVHSHVQVDIAQKIVDLGYGLRGSCQYIRDRIEENGIRRIMSTRFMQDAHVMKVKADWSLKTILDVYFESWTDEEKAKVQ